MQQAGRSLTRLLEGVNACNTAATKRQASSGSRYNNSLRIRDSLRLGTAQELGQSETEAFCREFLRPLRNGSLAKRPVTVRARVTAASSRVFPALLDRTHPNAHAERMWPARARPHAIELDQPVVSFRTANQMLLDPSSQISPTKDTRMRSRIRECSPALAALSALVVVGGCATRPSVTYTKITSSTDVSTLTDSFFLQTSTITISAAGGAKPGTKDTQVDLTVTSTPTEYPDYKVGITTNSSWWGSVNTVVNITKVDNTALVKEIGSQVTDHRVDLIKTAGSIITTGLGLVGFTGGQALEAARLPWSIRTDTQIAGAADETQPIQLKDGVTLKLGPLPPDAQPISKFPTGKTNVFVYAACRQATISFTYKSQDEKGQTISSDHTSTVEIADPRYIQLVAFPPKGKISTHSQCGVSVSTDSDTGISTGADIANALATQGKAIKDAIDAAKKK